MKKNLKLFIILIVSLMVMIACNSDDTTTEDNSESTNESTEETEQTENDEETGEDSDIGDEETEDFPETDGNEEVPVLELGETGVIEDTLGTYEVTPNSFRFTDSLGEGSEERISGNGRYVVVELDIKNIGLETLALRDIIQADLFREDGSSAAGFSDYPGIIQFEGEIKEGENSIGHLVFDTREFDYYEVAFGAYMPSHVSNEVRWALHAEDAE